MYDNLPELIEHYPLGSIVKGLAKNMKFTVNGYLYDGGMWHPMIQWMDGYYTFEQITEKFQD